MKPNTKNPFIVGDWIKRDEDFIGREELIQKYLSLEKHFYWLIGARRMGKTSLLRYLQRQFEKKSKMLPLFWDVSGANSAYDLKLSFLDSLDAAENSFSADSIAFDIESCEESSIIQIFRWLIRECQQKKIRLILLIDESEALLNVGGKDPLFLNRLKAVMLNSQFIHVILASNHGVNVFNTLDITHQSAPFLQQFLPPDYLTPWTKNEALILIRRCTNDKRIQNEVIVQTGCLPFLVQMTCFYFCNCDSLQTAISKINSENILDIFFRDDFNYFEREDINILSNVCRFKNASPGQLTEMVNLSIDRIKKRLTNLLTLGFLVEHEWERFKISNQFLQQWIELFFPPEQEVKWKSKIKNINKEECRELLLQFNDVGLTVSCFNNGKKFSEEEVKLDISPDKYKIKTFHPNNVKQVGQQIYFDIFGNEKVRQAHQEFIDGSEQKILILNRNKTLNSIPFELMHDGTQFLVLNHEMSRVSKINNKISPLKNLYNKEINILLIASNTPPEISLVDNEIIQLKNQLQKISTELQLKIKITAILSNEANYQTIVNLFSSGRFHFIHYAGHVGFNPASDGSYLYFWENTYAESRVKTIGASELKNFLIGSKVKFLYFNSCNSAKEIQHSNQQLNPFVDAIFKTGANTFIGNVLKADDLNAANFAIDFYWQLFTNQLDVSRALLQTRLKWSQKTLYQESGFLFWLQPVLWEKR